MCSTIVLVAYFFFFFFQAEDGIRDPLVTGVQTCALPICGRRRRGAVRQNYVGHQRPSPDAVRQRARTRADIGRRRRIRSGDGPVQSADGRAAVAAHMYVVSAFRRTSHGPAKAGHYVLAVILALGMTAAAQSVSIQLDGNTFKVLGASAGKLVVYAGAGDVPALAGASANERGPLVCR